MVSAALSPIPPNGLRPPVTDLRALPARKTQHVALDTAHGTLIVRALNAVNLLPSIIGAGLIVACFARNLTQAFLIANFPLALFMFFSSAVFPVLRVNLFTLAGHSFALFDILPPSHAVVALNKIFTTDSGPP